MQSMSSDLTSPTSVQSLSERMHRVGIAESPESSSPQVKPRALTFQSPSSENLGPEVKSSAAASGLTREPLKDIGSQSRPKRRKSPYQQPSVAPLSLIPPFTSSLSPIPASPGGIGGILPSPTSSPAARPPAIITEGHELSFLDDAYPDTAPPFMEGASSNPASPRSLSFSLMSSRQQGIPRPQSTTAVDARRNSFFGEEEMTNDDEEMGGASVFGRSQSSDSILDLDATLPTEQDVSKLLPTVETGDACGIKRVSVDTVASLLRGDYKDQIDKFYIVDCRYDYEYKGGHVKGGHNICTKQEIEHFYAVQKIEAEGATTSEATDDSKGEGVTSKEMVEKKFAVIFHCEFSKHRGPNSSRFFRQLDRTSNSYPRLTFPDVYIMEGGYKGFYEKYPDLCEPVGYVSMWDTKFQKECKERHKAFKKSWATTKSKRGGARFAPRPEPDALAMPALRRSLTLERPKS